MVPERAGLHLIRLRHDHRSARAQRSLGSDRHDFGRGGLRHHRFHQCEPDRSAQPGRAFRLEAFNGNTGNWFGLGVPAGFALDAWHTLSLTSTGATFEYRIDGTLVLTNPTVAGSDLLSAMAQGYNFGQPGSTSVDWDIVTVTAAVPEPAAGPLASALLVFGLAGWWRRRAAS